MFRLLIRKWLGVVLMLLLIPTSVLGHPEHGFNRPDAEDQSKREIERLVVEHKLPEFWNNAFLDMDKSGMQSINGKKRWIMVYEMPEEKAGQQKYIKIIMTPMGKFVGYEFIPYE
jgi:hypothetical protein